MIVAFRAAWERLAQRRLPIASAVLVWSESAVCDPESSRVDFWHARLS
jgi:hypothetical protein